MIELFFYYIWESSVTQVCDMIYAALKHKNKKQKNRREQKVKCQSKRYYYPTFKQNVFKIEWYLYVC